MLREIALILAFSVAAFFASLELLPYAVQFRGPIPVTRHTFEVLMVMPYFAIGAALAVVFGIPFGIFQKRRVVIYSLLTILPTPVLFGLFSTWPANRWIPVIGYCSMVTLFCGVAYIAHRVVSRKRVHKQ